jgi:hypothetical protein
MIPLLEESFPQVTVVVRPHPTESHEAYRRIAEGCRRVKVTNQGNVVPWLLSARALIHNGCTTGVEAFVMGVPAISYRPIKNEIYDDGFYHLPNALSYQCYTFTELQETLQRLLDGTLGPPNDHRRRKLVEHHLAGINGGPLACERMVDVLETIAARQAKALSGAWLHRLDRWIARKGLQHLRRIKSRLPGSHNRPEFQRHRYPGLPLEQVAKRISRLQQLLGDSTRLAIEPITATIYRIQVG